MKSELKKEDSVKSLIAKEIQYVLSKRLSQNYGNEAVWVYLRGLLATSQEEAEQSTTTNIKKAFILDFKDLKVECLKLLEDENAIIGNRFIYTTLIDFAIAEKNNAEAIKYFELLKVIDRIRMNYYQWRINNLKREEEEVKSEVK